MIVAQVMRSFAGGGAQRAAINLALGLAELGHESRLLALGDTGAFGSLVSERVPCDALGASGGAGALKTLPRLRRLIRERRFDVLHIHGSGVLPLVALAAAGGLGWPSLHFTWHDSGTVLGGRWWRRFAIRRALARCASVSGSSAGVAVRLQAALGGRAVRVMRNGVPDNGALGDPAAAVPIVVWAARIVPEKQPEWFIRAAAAARAAGLPARFVLAGAPLPRHAAYFRTVRDLASRLGEPVEFAGWIERSEDLCRGAAVGVQTSASEGLSMVLLEQMMAGLAVLATDVGDTALALAGGDAGMLLDPADESSFIAALRGVLADPRKRADLGARARARATGEYSCRAMGRQAEVFYRARNSE